MQKIKKGDTVQVISGNEVGARGEVDRVMPAWRVDRFNKRIGREPNRDRLLVRGVNIRKKHQRPISQTRTQTGIIDREMPVHISNVMLVPPVVMKQFEWVFALRMRRRCGSASAAMRLLIDDNRF
jgi:large subunit ribosomal protein L24